MAAPKKKIIAPNPEELIINELSMFRSSLKEFRQFILRGNVVDLAIAVVVGAAFNNVVQSLVKNIFTPLIAAVVGQPDFSKLHFTLRNSTFTYGEFLNALISFITIAIVVFFFVVQPVNRMMRKFKKDEPAEITTHECPECLSEIPLKATRCKFCTAKVEPAHTTQADINV
jgi:large conductance mechanosensitive channel